MGNGIRVLLRPVIQKWPKGELVSGVTFGLEIFGKGPGLAAGEVKPVKLVLHGAFLKKARDEKKDKPKFEKFATISGKVRLVAGKPVFALDAAGPIAYEKPEPTTPTFRRITIGYEKPAFENAPPVAPALKPTEQPPEPHPLSILRLPEEPKGVHFAIVGAALEIDGATSSEVKENDLLDVPLPPLQLRIVKVDDHFAPSVEQLEVKYKIGGLLGARVTLEISSKHYPGGPIFKRLLTPAELQDGLKTLTWDGKCNPAAGELKDHFLNPLFGPYELKLSDDAKREAKGSFKVLYHSLELKQGDWTPDAKEPPKASKKKDWVQYKLNELGYYGGPVGHDFDDYLKKAVIRYKVNHKKMHELVVTSYNDTITADLEAALSAGDNKRKFLDGDAFKNPKGSGRILVEAITYEETGAVTTEFNDSKATHEKDRLNRPLIPLLVDIFLLGKGKKKLAAPEAVGKARVNFRFTDVKEDITKQFTSTASQPSKTRAYVEKSLKLKGGRTATEGDNCHKDFGGIRDAAASDYETPFLVGTAYEPFELKKDAGQKACFSQAHADTSTLKNRLGQAGCFFRSSYVAGDSYKLKAELDFTGLPNAAELEKIHHVSKPEQRIHVETGTLQVWRQTKIAAVVTWPARKNDHQWGQIRTEFAKAYTDLDVSAIDTKPIGSVLSALEYKTIVAAATPHAAASVNLDPNSMVGVALPAQGALNAAAYKTALKTFASDNFIDPIYKALRRQLSTNLRKTHPVGFVVVEFLAHLPVNIKTAPPANNAVTAANTNYVTWAFSIGLPDSTILADQKDPDHVYYVVAHEMGHNFWLKHWEHAGGSKATDHDTNDHNCLMSYSSSSCAHANHRPGHYSPHFCGQCNLKLRGWDIDHAAILASS
jgi:hypothetical protein